MRKLLILLELMSLTIRCAIMVLAVQPRESMLLVRFSSFDRCERVNSYECFDI